MRRKHKSDGDGAPSLPRRTIARYRSVAQKRGAWSSFRPVGSASWRRRPCRRKAWLVIDEVAMRKDGPPVKCKRLDAQAERVPLRTML